MVLNNCCLYLRHS